LVFEGVEASITLDIYERLVEGADAAANAIEGC